MTEIAPELLTDARVMQAFFEPMQQMQATISVLCDGHGTQHQDPVSHTVLIMITTPLHVQLTAVGWQPFKGKELTFPYQRMSSEQKDALKALLTGEEQEAQWGVYEHAITYRRRGGPSCLKSLDVLEALCSTILRSVAYPDRRMRVAVCNIVLQRVQANVQVDKATLQSLNAKLFPPLPEGGVCT
jgi:hypothetical protein